MFKIGLIVNPFAGLGGSVALKGSDGEDIRQEALAKGATPKAQQRALQTLKTLTELVPDFQQHCQFYTCCGDMGETVAKDAGFSPQVVYQYWGDSTEEDTEAAAQSLIGLGIDLLLFAGGDGTARNVCNALQDSDVPVLGIPAGVKIHSGVYAVSPTAAAKVLEALLSGELTSVGEGEIRDIDEALFREGNVQSKWFGELKMPVEARYVQQVKCGGKEKEALVLVDMAQYLMDEWDEETLYVMGSGSTVAGIMSEMGLENTLLGVDVVQDQSVIASDVTEQELWDLVEQASKVKLVVTIIGGQGHLFGRGNQQLSPRVIRKVGLANICVVATKTKLASLQNRPMIVDTGDSGLDQDLCGLTQVITGYEDFSYYRVAQDYELTADELKASIETKLNPENPEGS